VTAKDRDAAGLVEAPRDRRRVLGRIRGSRDGASVVVLAAIHGNEPAGLTASRRVLEALEGRGVRGEVTFLAGNLSALEAGTRFVDKDLNRQWTAEKVGALAAADAASERIEDREQRELLAELARLAAEARGPLHFVDLHTSSAEGPPFLTVGDTLRNRRFASGFPLPIILGLEEQVDGALLEYLGDRGFVTVGVEAGQHDAPSPIDRHEAVIWLALEAAGVVTTAQVPERERRSRLLAEAARDVPPVLEVRYRHPLEPGDGFTMQPGLRNFERVARGRVLARDRRGPVVAPEAGRILLPLYQGQGNDGFFLAREVRPLWLAVSAALRRARLDGALPLLPGVRRHPGLADTLRVDTRLARWCPLEVFHLLGFRKRRHVGSELVVSRRRHDLAPPARVSLGADGA
jgi:succinylglutamate desuccinylase